VPSWFKAHQQIPVYQRDCSLAPTVVNTPLSSPPCFYQNATAQLKSSYDSRGNHNSQDVLLDFPDGRTATMEVDGEPGTWWTASQIDGSCIVEKWHNNITAVLKPGTRVLSRQNPELLGGTILEALGLIIVAITLGLWAYLFILWKQGDLSTEKRRTLQ